MYKKILFTCFWVCLFSVMGLAKTNNTNLCDEFVSDPPDWCHGNWNNEMEPHGCVLLDVFDRLKIRVVIYFAIQDIDLYTGPAVYYTTQFYGGPESGLIGPITTADLTPAIVNNEQVYVYNKGVYFNVFSDECGANPNDLISFDFDITLKTIQETDYPIVDNLELVPWFILDPDNDGNPEAPNISYAGNHDLCCNGGDIDPTGLVQNNEESDAAALQLADFSNEGGYPSGGNQGSFDFGITTNVGGKIDFQEPMITPNPFNQSLKIDFQALDNESTTIQLWDINGRLVHQSEHFAQSNGNQETLIDTHHLEAGFYYCSLKNASQSHTTKILKTK